MAGPPMVAACWAEDDAATARGNSGAGTTAGSNVCMAVDSKARAAPTKNTAIRMNSLLIQPPNEPTDKAAAARPSMAWQICRIRRRS